MYREIFLLLLGHGLKQNEDMKHFDKYLLNKNNTIVLKMHLLMRGIHEAFMFLRIIMTNHMKGRGFSINFIFHLFVFIDIKGSENVFTKTSA